VDHLVLLLLDHALLLRDVEQREQLLLGEVRGAGGAASCDTPRDERDHPQDRAQKARQPVDWAGGRKRDALGVRDGERLRRHLGGNEQDH
jgi:hypothetical protein